MIKNHLSKHPSSSSLKLSQMPALPPSQCEFFMFSLQVMLSLSQTFSEAMGGEWRLFVLVLLTEPTLSQLIHGRSSGAGCPWPWNWRSLTHNWTWSLQPCTLRHGASPQAFPWASLCNWSHQWCETPQSRAARRRMRMDPASFIAVAGAECCSKRGWYLQGARFTRGSIVAGRVKRGPDSRWRGAEQCFSCCSCTVGWAWRADKEDSTLQPLQCKGCSLCCQ